MTIRSPRRRVATLVLAALLIGLGTRTALGHAELATVTPPDKSSVDAPPAEIVMTFTEPLKPANSSIKLLDTANKVVAEGSTVDAADPKTMRLAVPAALPIGTFTARWTSTSALDGDVDHGTTTFTYAIGPVPGTVPPSADAGATGASPSAPAPVPSAGPSAASSAPPTAPATSTSDAVIPIVVALIVLAGLGVWLLRGRSRAAR